MDAARILVIDDDAELAELLSDLLTQEGFSVEVASDGEAGLVRALEGGWSLVVLDVMLPRLNGFEVLRRLREQSRVSVLMLTARGEDVDRIVGLEMGADDYLPKPFNPRELVARIRAVQRRAEGEPMGSAGPRGGVVGSVATPQGGAIEVDDIRLSARARTVTCAGAELPLTSVEFALLEVLLRAAGEVVTRETLSEEVLERRFSPTDRSIDVHVSNLRKKLGTDAEGRERIKTIRGTGYQYLVGA